jgi:hypothetical protein
VAFGRPLKVSNEGLHPVEASLVERFENVERGKQERARTAGRIEHRYALDRLPESAEQVRPLATFDHILSELPNIEVERDELVDLADVAVSGGLILPKNGI